MSNLIIDQEFVAEFPISDLIPHPQNPRIHDDEGIEESIETNLFNGAVLVQKSTNYLLDGHGRVKALKKLGATFVPAFVIDCDDAAALKILLARNAVGSKSTMDADTLAELLSDLYVDGDLIGTGYSADEVDDLLASLGEVVEMEAQPFEGGYVEDPDEAAHRAERVATTKASIGLHEVVLVYKEEDYDNFRRCLAVVSDFHAAQSTSEAVLAGIVNYAAALEADG